LTPCVSLKSWPRSSDPKYPSLLTSLPHRSCIKAPAFFENHNHSPLVKISSPSPAFPPHADGGWRGGGDAGGEVASSRRLPCLAGPLSTAAQVSAASSRRPPSTSVISLSSHANRLGAPHPSPRRQLLASRRRRPCPHGPHRWRRRQAGRRPPSPHLPPYLFLSSILHLALPKKINASRGRT
ncbi:unnamed protein product, partial [Urochloa humidicola]